MDVVGPLASIVAALTGVFVGAAVTWRSEARKEHSVAVVEVYWAMLDMREAFAGDPDYETQMHYKARLGQALRRFVSASVRLGGAEQRKGVRISKLLSWLAAGTWSPMPGSQQEFVEGPLERLVEEYPGLLANLEPDEESRSDFIGMVQGVQEGGRVEWSFPRGCRSGLERASSASDQSDL